MPDLGSVVRGALQTKMMAGMRRRGVWVLPLAAIAALAALGYLGMRDRPPAAPAGPLEQLSIALPMAPHGALLHVAAAQGYFREEGLEVTILPATHGAAALDLLIQGKVDLAVAAEVPVVKAVMQGEAIALVANTLYSQNDPAIVARRDRGIAAVPDLAGKRFGVTFGTSGEYFLWAFLIQARVAPESVTLVDLSPAEIVPALANGAVDAVATWQPFVSKAQSALGDNGVLFAGTDAYTQTFVVVARSEYLQGHSRAMQKLVRALLRAEQFVQSRPEEALNVVAERLKSGIQELRAQWSHFDFKVDLSQSQLIALESQARWAMTRGYSAKEPVPNLLPRLYLDALLAVKPDRVTVIHGRGH